MNSRAEHSEPRVEAAALTDIGHHRDTNEDAFLIATLQRSMNVHAQSPGAQGWFQGEPAGTLLVVADGMGGQGGGAVASRTAVHAVADYLLNSMPWARVTEGDLASRVSQTGLRAQLSSALVMTDKTVKTTAAQSSTPQMGTTLTMALVLWPALYVAHVGDTRCYLLQSGLLRRLTTDHNLAQRFVDESPESVEPPAHFQNILWNALGGTSGLPKPEVHKMRLEPGATLLLCSDGLNKHVSDQRIEQVLKRQDSCAARCAMLVELANEGGGTDNVTAVVAQLHHG
ncbi:MAG TPA: protein phosphatase 2C domain-containing protein [Polyangiaceae bacterium]|nr:protein phosphatase 2C domain-containing protein [Polyangiaceae bacterium]